MQKKPLFILVISFLILVSSSSLSYGASLFLEPDSYNLQLTHFNPHSGADSLNFSLGYGGSAEYDGYGLGIIAGEVTTVQLEYQFLPEDRRDEAAELNYAFRGGAVSGNYWAEDDPALLAGLILERQVDMNELYFDGNLLGGSTIWADLELGIRGDLGPGIQGVVGYKILATQDKDPIRGFHYGIQTEF